MSNLNSPGEVFRISCTNYPQEFASDKTTAKQYFRQFGRLKRIVFKQKSKVLYVEYLDRPGFLNALKNAGDYNGHIFNVAVDDKPSPEKKKRAVKNKDPDWTEDPEVRAELEAMGAHMGVKTYNLRPEKMQVDSVVKKEVPKLKRSWVGSRLPMEAPVHKEVRKKVVAEKTQGVTPEQMDLITIIKQQNHTIEEKYRCLDARDKFIRILLKRKLNPDVKTKATVGNCPDMCPEKERLMRETQHQVALYEQEEGGRGMNHNLAVKQYSRSSADQEAPLPYELRPVKVLQMSMGYLLHKIVGLCDTPDVNVSEWYHFLWDRTRGIRKDITQQELCCQGAVELVEQCARFHIHCSARLAGEDPSVFDQKINTENLTKCLQTLKYMYHDLQVKGESCPNEAEFRAYIILLNLNDGNFMWEVQQLKGEVQKSQEVKFALNVYSALDKKNYVKFFKLVAATSYLNACILMRYFVQVRVMALKTLIKVYARRTFVLYPIDELRRILAFDDVESAMDFFGFYGLKMDGDCLVLDHRSYVPPEFPYVQERSMIVEEKRNLSVGEVICGKPLPPKHFEYHLTSNSFDNRGYLILNEYLRKEDLAVKPQIPVKPEAKPTFSSLKEEDSSLQIPVKPIFGNLEEEDSVKPIFGNLREDFSAVKPEIKPTGIFGGSIFGTVPQPVVKRGGFPFDLSKPAMVTPKNIFGSTWQNPAVIKMPISPEVQVAKQKKEEELLALKVKMEEERRLIELEKERLLKEQMEKEERLRMEHRRRIEEQKMRAEQEEKRRIEEKRRLEEELRQKRLREEKLRQEEEEEKKRLEAQRLKLIEEKREINRVVTNLMEDLLMFVEEDVRTTTLENIKTKIRNRLVVEVFRKWRLNVIKNKKKRKAVDCSPVWISAKSAKQEAKELYTNSQDLTLTLKRRYKYGTPLDIDLLAENTIQKINLTQLVAATLIKRHYQLENLPPRHIFWKVDISIPNSQEMNQGLTRLQETLDQYLQFKDNIMVDQLKTKSQTITCGLEKQQGINPKDIATNGIILVTHEFNPIAYERLRTILTNIKELVKIPAVVIMQDYDETCKDTLDKLKSNDIISDYAILIDKFSPENLTGLIDEALIFLSNKVQKPPLLQLDTLQSFITNNLCTEVWKRANSFAKWNTEYKKCLQKPNLVIKLYNEGLLYLERLAINETNLAHSDFPQVFKNYLESPEPDYLPCDYKYFPLYWRNKKYLAKLSQVFKNLRLPQYNNKWPVEQPQLEQDIKQYCQQIYHDPKVYYKVMSVILGVQSPLWSDVIELLSLELLKQQDLSNDDPIFKQLIVVYNPQSLNEYNTSDWFYLQNSMIEREIKKELKQDVKESTPTKTPPTSADIDKTLEEVNSRLNHSRDTKKMKEDLEMFNKLMEDLETGIKIHKKISEKFEHTLKNVLEN